MERTEGRRAGPRGLVPACGKRTVANPLFVCANRGVTVAEGVRLSSCRNSNCALSTEHCHSGLSPPKGRVASLEPGGDSLEECYLLWRARRIVETNRWPHGLHTRNGDITQMVTWKQLVVLLTYSSLLLSTFQSHVSNSPSRTRTRSPALLVLRATIPQTMPQTYSVRQRTVTLM